jgi:hypothetical protein
LRLAGPSMRRAVERLLEGIDLSLWVQCGRDSTARIAFGVRSRATSFDND